VSDQSEAQLDAQAAAPQLATAVELRIRLSELRLALYRETPDRVHQQHTSKTPDDEVDAKGWALSPDEGGVGLPFSARFHRYLRTNAGRHQRKWDLGPDPRSRPAMASIVEVSEWCSPRHTSHLRPYHVRSLCSQMVLEAAYLGQEPRDVAWLHGLELEQTERMLVAALRHAYEWRSDIEARLSREPGTEAPLPERRRPAA
jgi:hypothetical protein